jgi:uncharacterized protein (TIGR03118 family)
MLISACLSGLMVGGLSTSAGAQFYQQHNIASDGAIPIDHQQPDPDLVNAWGLAFRNTSPWWVGDNGTNEATIYNGNTGVKAGLVVKIPGATTGVVGYPGSGFLVNGTGKAAMFIFATEDGNISGWNGGTMATIEVPATGAVYKGLTFAATGAGDRIYATDFRNGKVDVFDSTWTLRPGGFADPSLPAGYAPFGIQNVGGTIFVTYALQDAVRHDDVAGPSHGFVNAFDTDGHLLYRAVSRGPLNSPWGIALAPGEFGQFSGDLLIGNFGDGRIHAFEPPASGTGELVDAGPLHSASGPPLVIDGLWSLQFGNGRNAGPLTTLFFTAGPFGEQHGLFGSLVPTGPPGQNKK